MTAVPREHGAVKILISRHNGKYRDGPSCSKYQSESSSSSEEESIDLDIPLIKCEDTVVQLPKYAGVLSKNADDAVTMDILDSLQQDFEKLLTYSALRYRYFKSELFLLDKFEEKRNKKGKFLDKTPLKRKRVDEKWKHKDIRNGMRIIKKPFGMKNYSGETPIRSEVPRVALPKNDTSEKFWTSVEPYCSDVQRENVLFLDTLIFEFSKDVQFEIPDLGEHYTQDWSDEVSNDEQTVQRFKQVKIHPERKNGSMSSDSKGSTSGLSNKLEKLRDLSFHNSNAARATICMEKRLKKELVNQGVITDEDLNKNMQDDEILAEIYRCQEELATVNTFNLTELKKLKHIVNEDYKKQEVKDELERIDRQILEVYNKIQHSKQSAPPSDNEDSESSESSSDESEAFINQAYDLLKRQFVLNNEMEEESSMIDNY